MNRKPKTCPICNDSPELVTRPARERYMGHLRYSVRCQCGMNSSLGITKGEAIDLYDESVDYIVKEIAKKQYAVMKEEAKPLGWFRKWMRNFRL